MDLSHVKVKQVIELRYADGTSVDDAVDHALAHSRYNMGAIIRWELDSVTVECKDGDNRKLCQSWWHEKRRQKAKSS